MTTEQLVLVLVPLLLLLGVAVAMCVTAICFGWLIWTEGRRWEYRSLAVGMWVCGLLALAAGVFAVVDLIGGAS